MGAVHYLANLPGCTGNCHQGDVPCESPALCGGELVQRRRAAFWAAMAVPSEAAHAASEVTTSPADLEAAFERQRYGYTGAPRLPRRPLPGALSRAAEAKASRPMPLPELLQRKGAMTAHPAPTWRERLRRAWLDFRIRRLGRF